jgi:hypothetical protein
VLWQEGLPSQIDGNWDVLNIASPGKFWYKEHPANTDPGQVYDRSWTSRNFVTTHRGRCHQIIECD